MAGIGKYTKGKKFTLKSGNNPAFKMIGNTEAGDSPITNEFGIGKGVSPYKEGEKEEKGLWYKGKKGDRNRWKMAGKTILAAAMGGLNAVYGNKEAKSSKVKFSDDKDETDELTIDEKIAKALAQQKADETATGKEENKKE